MSAKTPVLVRADALRPLGRYLAAGVRRLLRRKRIWAESAARFD